MKNTLPHPHPTWESAKYKLNEVIEFIDSMNPIVIRKATVIGWDCQDRVLVRYEYHGGIFAEGMSIHTNRILPRKI